MIPVLRMCMSLVLRKIGLEIEPVRVSKLGDVLGKKKSK